MTARSTSVLHHSITRRAGFGLGAAALVAGLAPAARGDGGGDGDYDTTADYIVSSYLDGGRDSGGYGAAISKTYSDGTIQRVDFKPYGELLLVQNRRPNYGLWVEVRVYHSADAGGAPYGLLDTDTFSGYETSQTYNLGTPDGSGNIKEGRWVAIRMEGEAVGQWSPWAYGKA